MTDPTPADLRDTGASGGLVVVDRETMLRRARGVGLAVAREYEQEPARRADGGLSPVAEAWLDGQEDVSETDAVRWQTFREVSEEIEERLVLPPRGTTCSGPTLDRAALLNEARHAAAAYLRQTLD